MFASKIKDTFLKAQTKTKMGNSLWYCEDCKSPNMVDKSECHKCGTNRPVENSINIFAGLGSKNFPLISRNRTQKSLAVEKSAVVKTNINEYARAHTPVLDKKTKEFYDLEFPATNVSLYIDGVKIKRKNLLHSNGFKHVRKWLRPQDIKVGMAFFVGLIFFLGYCFFFGSKIFLAHTRGYFFYFDGTKAGKGGYYKWAKID